MVVEQACWSNGSLSGTSTHDVCESGDMFRLLLYLPSLGPALQAQHSGPARATRTVHACCPRGSEAAAKETGAICEGCWATVAARHSRQYGLLPRCSRHVITHLPLLNCIACSMSLQSQNGGSARAAEEIEGEARWQEEHGTMAAEASTIRSWNFHNPSQAQASRAGDSRAGAATVVVACAFPLAALASLG